MICVRSIFIVPFLLVGSLTACAAHLQPPTHASYLTSDGAIAIIGNDGMEELINELNALFVRYHPGFKFAVTAKGSSVGMPALTAGATAIAPMSREPWVGEANGYKQVMGHEPLDIRIGYSGHGPRNNGKTPPAVYLHPDNPLASLTVQQLAKIVTSGQPGGDINTWGQLGMDGEWKDRRIHIYGLRDNGGFATNQRLDKFGGLPFSPRYEPLPSRESILRAVANDPYSIGLTGWVKAADTAPQLRTLPISAVPGTQPRTPSYEDVAGGAYPLSSYLHLFVTLEPGQSLEPFIKEYLRLALSEEGQKLVRLQTSTVEGYVPLSLEDLAQERHKLEEL
ncbi:phosphate-binding protein [Pseudomonas sp. LTJR-52]|uniref:PstS family phosphate ABC transporter substrate-binding protein n=1 Tax=Pseudomonas sp. LTJR-52 TaxID=2479392 RepID=UPI000EFC08D6|nr:substrate-binding domain-containing protein [Pseudomonas sp. LTJR-52]AYN97032.1 phosphate-binding protein [Pseudomonas sp. LTJR-52]